MIDVRTKILVNEYNPWWDGQIINVPEFKRHVFTEMKKYIRTKQIIAIVGLRRVGKTVLMKQIIKELADMDNKNVFYFLFDELLVQKPEILEDIIEYYLKNISGTGQKYIFLDEIQKVPYWQDVLKRLYDARDDLKFFVSGSASLQIKKSKESLAGRIFDFHLPVLTFREFLEMNGIVIDKVTLDQNDLYNVYNKNLHKASSLDRMFSNYVLRGAFPEISKEGDETIVKNYIKSSLIDKMIMYDIPAIFEVRRKDILFSILEYCSRETSNLIDISNLAKMFGTDYQTIRSYIFYLINSFIIDLSYNYSKSTARQLRKNKKIYIAHPSISMTMSKYSQDVLNVSEVMGKYAESIAFQHAKILNEKISFWRTPQKEEIDIILENENLLPIEVKYKNNPDISEVSNVIKFMKKHECKIGFVLTRDLFKEHEFDGNKILFIPLWLFLLAV